MSIKPVSVVALVAVVVIAALAVLGSVLTSRAVNSQNQALLNNDTTQAGVYVSSIFSGVSSDLDAVATGITATGGSPAAFAAQAGPFVTGPIAVALLRRTDSGWVVAASVGHGLSPGQMLSTRVSSAAARAGTKVQPVLVSSTHHLTTLGFAKGAPLVPPGLAVYEQLSIPTLIRLDRTKDAPFHELNAVVYAGPTATSANLVLDDAPSLPLVGPKAETHFTLGAVHWLLVATAKSSLAGGFPNAAPYVLLGVGLLLALVMGLVIDILLRRQRYAAVLVEERTTELVASQEALVLGERLAAVGEMATVVGHELRNPLGAVTNAHYLLRQNLGDPATVERYLAMAERELARASNLAEDLTVYMRDRVPVPVPVNLKDLVREVLEASPPPVGVAVTDETDGLTLTADRAQVGQILTNLIGNAYQAMHDQGSLRLGAASDNGDVVITIQDSGEGMDPGLAAKVFEPFFTTRTEGTGLGLAIVRRLAEGHGGSVSIENAPQGGAVATVRLPLRPPAQAVST